MGAIMTNQEIRDAFEAMEGSTAEKVTELAKLTELPERTIECILVLEPCKAADNIKEKVDDDQAADVLKFVPGTAIYKLVEERLDVLDKIIKSATKEYKELAGYLNGREIH